MYKDEKMERLRERMHKVIDLYGIDSKEVRRVSSKLDKLINLSYSHEKEYPEKAEMKYYYYESYEHLKKITREYGQFPTIAEWTKYCKEMCLLCAVSMQYISGRNWNDLRDFIITEIK